MEFLSLLYRFNFGWGILKVKINIEKINKANNNNYSNHNLVTILFSNPLVKLLS